MAEINRGGNESTVNSPLRGSDLAAELGSWTHEALVHEVEILRLERALLYVELSKAAPELPLLDEPAPKPQASQQSPALWLGPDGSIRTVNAPASRLFGRDASRLQGLRLGQLISDEDQTRLEAFLQRVFSGDPNLTCDVTVSRTPDSETVLRMHSRGPAATGACKVILEDISALRRTEADLLESEYRFNHLFEQSPQGLAMTALDGVFTRVNPAFASLLGYRQSEIIGLDPNRLTHPQDQAVDSESRSRLMGSGLSSCQIEKRYIHRNGGTVFVSQHVSLARSRSGSPLYFRDLDEAAAKLCDMELIRSAHEYLSKLQIKEKLTQEYFLKSFVNTAIYRSL